MPLPLEVLGRLRCLLETTRVDLAPRNSGPSSRLGVGKLWEKEEGELLEVGVAAEHKELMAAVRVLEPPPATHVALMAEEEEEEEDERIEEQEGSEVEDVEEGNLWETRRRLCPELLGCFWSWLGKFWLAVWWVLEGFM